MADRPLYTPAADGSILNQRPAIEAAASPNLPAHVAVAFHSESGWLGLRPDSPAFATQLRLLSARIVAATHDAIGAHAVRNMRATGFHQALAAHQSAPPAPRADPDIVQAVERQTAAMRELSRRACCESGALTHDVPAEVASPARLPLGSAGEGHLVGLYRCLSWGSTALGDGE
ncbi:hypothetical protein ACFWPU_01700 [Streptomyces sp. NPDC058471]|uniref:hypothetical protein n=1 Tax=Streptomyces sp. NPDC058471 TaxID=3346516 RepID=UPI00366201AA